MSPRSLGNEPLTIGTGRGLPPALAFEIGMDEIMPKQEDARSIGLGPDTLLDRVRSAELERENEKFQIFLDKLEADAKKQSQL